jgi:streptogramin lyase
MNRSDRTTWVDPEGRTWRIELVTGRWQLSRYVPASETWQPVGSYPNREAAISGAYGENQP